MIMFLWDACGAGQFRGVTDDKAKAQHAAEACITSGLACSARVEMARAVLGVHSLTTGYYRTGRGWAAEHRDGRVTWVPFTESPELEAEAGPVPGQLHELTS